MNAWGNIKRSIFLIAGRSRSKWLCPVVLTFTFLLTFRLIADLPNKLGDFMLFLSLLAMIGLAFVQSILKVNKLGLANELLQKEIDSREAASEDVFTSMKFLESIIENIPNMIFIKDAKELRFVRFNKAGENLLGFKRQELIGKNDYDFFPKDQADAFTAKDRQVLSEKGVHEILNEPVKTHSGIRFLHTLKIPLFGVDAKPSFLLGISEDVTDKNLAEERRLSLLKAQAVRAEAEKIALIQSFLGEATIALTASLDSAEKFHSFCSTVTKSVVDCCIIEIFSYANGTLDPGGIAFGENLRSKDSIHRLISGSRLKAEIRQVLVTGVPIKCLDGEAGEPSLFYVIVPIVARNLALGVLTLINSEEKLRSIALDSALAEELAQRAAIGIDHAMLYHKAQEASRVKSAFIANMSHEIRTPLSSIIGFTELLLLEELNSQQGEYLSAISRNGVELLRIVDEILDIAKIESNRITIESITFSLPNLLKDILSTLEVRSQKKMLFLKLNLPSQLPEFVTADPTRLRQLLFNLVGNAIKFTGTGGVEVSVTLQTSADVTHLFFNVADTGIGIAEEQQGIIFEPFIQADISTTRRFGGTGLGLYLARNVCRLMGGDLEVLRSQVGVGTEFRASVRVKIQSPGQKNINAEGVHGTSFSQQGSTVTKSTSGSKGHVLVVDDSLDNRLLLSSFVNRLGYSVEVAEDGADAIEKVKVSDFDLILIDIQMPGLDGVETMQFLHSGGFLKPIICVTAHSMNGDREHLLGLGFQGYLAKPVSQTEIELILKTHCQKNE